MSKETYIGGDLIEKIGGSYKIYAKEGYDISSNKEIIFNAKGGIKHGKPKSPPKIENKIIDIAEFVAGTTDPINTTGAKHQANTEYWQGIDEKTRKETKESINNFWHKIKELKLQYNNLNIEGDFFSWSGDNNTEERNLAAERLLDVILRTYKGWMKNQEVHLHLIGHSHGGNVINQFTELIANKEMIAKSEVLKKHKFTEFPKLWKVKSITYLSTPFFQKKHQLNHSKLHKDCKIINVHNEYDLTQQLIADFTLVNLEGLLKSFQMDKFDVGIKTLKSVNSDIIKTYLEGIGLPNSHKKRAIPAWKEMAKAFLGLNLITAELIKYVNSLKIEHSNLQKEKASFITLLNNLLQWTYDVHKNYTAPLVDFDKATWAKKLNLTQGLKVLNILLDIKTSPKDSYLLSLLAGLFGESKGLTDSIDETSWTPTKQAQGLSILDVPIFKKDPYNSRNKKSQFDTFLKGTQGAVHSRNLEDMLMRLFSQFIKPDSFSTITKVIDWGVEPFVFGKLDTEVTILRKNLKRYSALVTKYNANLVNEKDEKEIKDLGKRPGTIPYLAMVSHSLSHTQLWPEVEEGLKSAFSSGKNTGYKKK